MLQLLEGLRCMIKADRDDKMIQAIRLRAQGLSFVAIATCVGINSNTLHTWRRKYPHFDKSLTIVEERAAKDLVEHSILELAKGAKEEEHIEEWMETRMIDGEEVPVKRVKKVKYKAPNEKAINMLAYRHDRGTYTNEDKVENNLTIKITQQNRSLSLEERKKLLEDEGKEVIEVDYKELQSELEGEAGELGLLGE